MKPDSCSLNDLLAKEAQYIIPLYQRAYVWDEEKQWEPLWEDIQILIEKMLQEQEFEAKHFLGSLVLKQISNRAAVEPQKHEVIDGQQRLITLQLVLASLLKVGLGLEIKENKSLINRLKKCIQNEDFAEPGLFKLLPTFQDREVFKKIIISSIGGKVLEDENQDSLLIECFLFFEKKFNAWIKEEESFEQRFKAAFSALHDGLYLVILNLDQKDNAQLIFETLNARGTPLLQSDLIKNYLLHQIKETGEDPEKFHKENWADFEREVGNEGNWWRTDLRLGRLTRPHLDAFLQFFIGLKAAREISPFELFEEVKKIVGGKESKHKISPEVFIREIKDASENYYEMNHYPPDTREGVFFERLDILDTSTAYPLLLRLKQVSDKKTYKKALEMIESFLVRRMVCKLTPKNYNRYLYSLVGLVKEDDPVSKLKEKLLEGEEETTVWPSDKQFREALTDEYFYYKCSRRRLRMLLWAINDKFQKSDTKAEAVWKPDAEPQIEHVLPQKWEENWPTSKAKVEYRQSHVHRLGNLCLVTAKLNQKLSNAGWTKKRKALEESAVITTTRRILKNEQWDEKCISERTDLFTEAALEIWPRI